MNQHLLNLHERAVRHLKVEFGLPRIARPAYPVWPTNNFPFEIEIRLGNPNFLPI